MTVTSHEALYPPFTVVAVMVAFPVATALTFPSWSTVAIFSSLDFQVTDLSSALSGPTAS